MSDRKNAKPMKLFAFRLRASTRTALLKAAAANGVSASDWTRSIIERELADRGTSPTLFDRLAALGVLGCVTDGPSDLATNPKHMEGFGK